MAVITVELVGADAVLAADLAGFVAGRGFGPGETPVTITVSTRAECDTVGAALAEWVGAHPGSYQAFIDGPGASSEIHKLHTVDDTNLFIGAVAACSGLL